MRLFRLEPRMPLQPAADSALRRQNFRTAAGQNRHSRRRSGGQFQGAARKKRAARRKLSRDSRKNRQGAADSARAFRGRGRFLERRDEFRANPKILPTRRPERKPARTRDVAAGLIGARARPHFKSRPHDCRFGNERKHRADAHRRSHRLSFAGQKLLVVN